MNALATFLRVIGALVRREALTRFGRFRFGYIYAFVEPALYIGVFALARELMGSNPLFGDNTLLFLVTALLTVRTVLIIAGRIMGAITANLSLLTFPIVKTFDVIIGRAVLEVITLSVVAFAFVIGLYVATGVWAPDDLQTTLAGYGAALLLGVSIGSFNAVLSRILPFWERVWSLMSLPLLFMSAVFYLPSSLPTNILNILWYNPVLHVVEWVRSGIYISYQPFLSTSYVLWVSGTLLLLTLVGNRFFTRLLLDR